MTASHAVLAPVMILLSLHLYIHTRLGSAQRLLPMYRHLTAPCTRPCDHATMRPYDYATIPRPYIHPCGHNPSMRPCSGCLQLIPRVADHGHIRRHGSCLWQLVSNTWLHACRAWVSLLKGRISASNQPAEDRAHLAVMLCFPTSGDLACVTTERAADKAFENHASKHVWSNRLAFSHAAITVLSLAVPHGHTLYHSSSLA